MTGTGASGDARADRRVFPWSGEEPVGANGARSALRDAVFLAAIVLLSCAPYAGGLGLYSDDWAFLSALHEAGGGYGRLVGALLPIEMATRPVQALEVAALYAWFGLDPLGYHVVNSLVLVAAVVLLHLSLRALGFARLPALLVPLVFGLLPHYSTDRVWIAAFQAHASVSLCFLSLFADVRFVSRPDTRRWLWKALGSLALLGSVLAYEVTAALLLFSVLVLAWHAHLLHPRAWSRRAAPTLLAIASNVIVLAAAIVYKLSTTVRADISGGYVLRVLRIVREAVPVHFGEYGVALPVRVAQVLRNDPDPWVVAAGVLIGLLVGAYLMRAVLPTAVPSVGRLRWSALILLGAVLFGLGYGVSLTTWEIGFHATGANNRTAIAAALGVSCVFVGVLGAAAGWLPSERARRSALAVLVALLCASAAIVTGTVADRWVRAAHRQDAVIAAIHSRFPDLAPGSTLLLDGLCPYVGPAPVFATSWDVTGMLQLTYDERDVRGDVLKPNSQVTPEGVRTLLFDDVISVYPYGAALYVLHVGTGDVRTLTDEGEARRWFDRAAGARPACAPYTDGDGSDVF